MKFNIRFLATILFIALGSSMSYAATETVTCEAGEAECEKDVFLRALQGVVITGACEGGAEPAASLTCAPTTKSTVCQSEADSCTCSNFNSQKTDFVPVTVSCN